VSVAEVYHNINTTPVLGTALNTAAAAGLTYAGSKKFGPKLVGLLTKGMSPEARMVAMRAASGNKFAGRMAVLAAVGEFIRNLSVKGVFDVEKPIDKIKGRIKGPEYVSRLYDPSTLQKTAMDIDLDRDTVYTKKVIGAINQDRFLDSFNKLEAGTLIAKADTMRDGRTSGRKIVNTALRAGVGFVPAYMFGKTIAGLAGLPKESLGRIGAAGGIAAALYNTGVFGDKA
jgi:hypothetical protein